MPNHTVAVQVLDEIAEEALKGLSSTGSGFYVILDRDGNDSALLEQHILRKFDRDSRREYTINFAKLSAGKKSLSQLLLSLIFLKSDFLRDFCTCVEGTDKDICSILVQRTADPSICTSAQRLFTCKICGNRQKEKLGIEYDLADDQRSKHFLLNAIRMFYTRFNEEPVFYFRNFPIENYVTSMDDILFIRQLSRMPAVFVFTARSIIEYLLTGLEKTSSHDHVRVFSVRQFDDQRTSQILMRIRTCSGIDSWLPLDDPSMSLLVKRLGNFCGFRMSASALYRAIVDLASYLQSNIVGKLTPSVIEEFFSTSR